jgi:two-component system, NarL family, response regulator LiaR
VDEPARVLVVDDDAAVRRVLRLTLERTGTATVVGEARNGALGVAAARRLQPDAIVIGGAMPTMTGWEAVPLLCEALPHAPVIVFSADGRGERGAQALRDGAHAICHKDESISKLLLVLDAATADGEQAQPA